MKKRLIPEPSDYDPYGKDLPPLGSGGKEPTYRIQGGNFVRLTNEEAELAKLNRFRNKPEKPQ